MSATILLFGAKDQGHVYLSSQSNPSDAEVPVTLRAVTAVWAPSGWWGDALWRTVTVTVSANVGASFLLTPIVDGIVLDGTNGAVDSRVNWSIPTPSAGQRVQTKRVVGLSRPITIGTTSTSVVGLRGTWLQILIETVGAIDIPVGELNPDFRVDALETEVEPLLRTQQVVNAGVSG